MITRKINHPWVCEMNNILKNNILKNSILIIPAILLSFFIYLSIFHQLLYNEQFYDQQFQKMGIYNTFTKYQAMSETREVLSYIKDQDKGRISSEFFSQRDKEHMIDVKAIIQGTYTFKWLFLTISLILIILIIVIAQENVLKTIYTALFFTSIFMVCLAVFLYLVEQLIPSAFSNAFLTFHKVFFTNDLWMLDPAKDNLINLFPEQFFYTFLAKIFITGLYVGVIILVFLPILKYFYKLLLQIIKDFKK